MSSLVIADDAVAVYRPVVPLALAVAAGILADRWFSVTWQVWLLAMAGSGLLAWLTGRSLQRLSGICLLFSLACGSAAWHQYDWDWFPADNLAFRLDRESRPVCLRAQLVSSPRLLPAEHDPLCSFPQQQMSSVQVSLLALRQGNRWQPASGGASLWVTGRLDHVACGDRVELLAFARQTVDLAAGRQVSSNRGRSRRELVRLRAISPAAVQLLEAADRRQPWIWIEGLRRRVESSLFHWLGPRHAPLASAMLIGVRDQVPSSQRDAFFLTGTVHLLAISGLHVGILAGLLWIVVRMGWMPRLPGLLLLIVLVVFYCWLTGGRPSIQRATVLVCLLCLAELLFRPVLPVNCLATAAVVILLLDPSSLFQAGTQLSFIAVLALIHAPDRFVRRPVLSTDPLERLVQRVADNWRRRTARAVGRALLLSIYVWVATAPLVIYHFHLISPVGVLLGCVLGIPLTIVLVGGLLTAVLSPLGGLAALAAWPCGWGLEAIIRLTRFARELPGAYFWTPSPPGWLVGLFYLLLLAGWLCRLPRPRWLLRCGLVALFVVGLLLAGRLARKPPSGVLRATFISVDHGTSVLLEFPSGQVWLYDAGHLGHPLTAGRSISNLLWSRGIHRIDRLFLSHADIDHFNAIPYLVERFQVSQMHAPPALQHANSAAEESLLTALHRAGLQLDPVVRGSVIPAVAGVSVEVLHPPAEAVFESDNAGSLVLEIRFGVHRLLLPGDLELDGLDDVLALPARRVDILMAPHHGSRNSEPARVCRWCRASLVVVSSGHRQASGEEAYRAAGCRLYSTRRDGHVTVELSTTGYRIRTERGSAAWRIQPR